VSASSDELAALAGRLSDMARSLAAADSHAESSQVAPDAGRTGDAPGIRSVRIASELAATSADALRLSVETARAAGRTWQELGDVLGVSRQAAFQRFGHPVDPRTGRPMSSAMPPGAAPRATELMINWIEERYDAVQAELSQTVAEKLSDVGGLPGAWAMVVGSVGSYEGMGEAAARQVGDMTIVDIPMTFEVGEMKGRVVFDKDGKVGGLFVLPPAIP